MTYKQQLIAHDQTCLLNKPLSPTLIQDIQTIDWNVLSKQLYAIDHPQKLQNVHPIHCTYPATCFEHPNTIFAHNNIGCLVMAGGLATRLGSDQPKGVLPVSPIEHKSLFQILCEKIRAFSTCYHTHVPLAIMTSANNNAQTQAHFSSHKFFGLRSVDFFMQSELPFLDMNKQLCIHNDHIMHGPDGNGSVFAACEKNGIFKKWKTLGIKALCIIQIDNPLLDPFHPHVFEPIFRKNADISAAAVQRIHKDEHVGVFIQENSHTRVAEYSEIVSSKYSIKEFPWANISFFACSLDFAQRAANHILPIHAAKKFVNGSWIWKSEYFIFDHLVYAHNAHIIPISRDRYFSPIKNKKGPNSIETAQQAMVHKDMQRIKQLGMKIDSYKELSQETYYLNQ